MQLGNWLLNSDEWLPFANPINCIGFIYDFVGDLIILRRQNRTPGDFAHPSAFMTERLCAATRPPRSYCVASAVAVGVT